MEKLITYIAAHDVFFVFGILAFFGLIEAIFGYLTNSKRSKGDVLIETVNTFVLLLLTKPLITFLSYQLIKLILPNQQNSLKNLPFWAGLLVFLLVDDFLQYWYHRSAHEYKWLWKWHRPHHTTTEMGLLVSYRQAVYYYLTMPNIWWLGIFTFLGGGIPVAIGLILKQLVIISSHSLATWDSFFYKRPVLVPIIKVLERLIVTPAFHHGHHAVSKIDGIGNPNGNYGNMFSIWDQLFGTATFVHAFPTAYGIPNDPNDDWTAHVFYPLVKSDKHGSELSKDYTFEQTTVNEPVVLTLKEGNYLYCTCGYSKTQPFCDGSHHGTKFQPMMFSIKKEREYKLCQCKTCVKGPFCDDSHLKNKS
ncbi:MAG: sterol desaturase family protein [Saprospiraceae bacterium]|nr:sterol desaturase family protein [Saprospiraceae bacterium]